MNKYKELADRLAASMRIDAINGDAYERIVLKRQIAEAIALLREAAKVQHTEVSNG